MSQSLGFKIGLNTCVRQSSQSRYWHWFPLDGAIFWRFFRVCSKAKCD